MFCILFISLLAWTEVYSKHNLLDQEYLGIDNVDAIFEQFIDKYKKTYKPEEYKYRFDIFKEKLMKINDWNNENPGTYGVNEFSDLTFDEFSQMYLGFNGNLSNVEATEFKSDKLEKAPQTLDWREFGVVSPVKHQQNCGSCYAFSAIAHIESRYAMKYSKKPLILSEQQALDCDDVDSGCAGGIPHNVFRYIKEGVMLDRDYPYVHVQGFCKANPDKAPVKIKAFTVFNSIDEDDLKEAVASYGPLSIAMVFTERMLHVNKDAVYKPVDCGRRVNNHAVLLVGYGTDQNSDDFWIIKNSWGSGWGDRGYIRILRGLGVCNIGSYAAVAEVEKKSY